MKPGQALANAMCTRLAVSVMRAPTLNRCDNPSCLFRTVRGQFPRRDHAGKNERGRARYRGNSIRLDLDAEVRRLFASGVPKHEVAQESGINKKTVLA